jgi:hypothetical protein
MGATHAPGELYFALGKSVYVTPKQEKRHVAQDCDCARSERHSGGCINSD